MLRGSCTPGLFWSLETPWGPRPEMALPTENPSVQETSLTTLFLFLSLSLVFFFALGVWGGLPLEHWPSYKGLSSQWPAPSSSALLPVCVPLCQALTPLLPASRTHLSLHHLAHKKNTRGIDWTATVGALFPGTSPFSSPSHLVSLWTQDIILSRLRRGTGGGGGGEARVLAPGGEGKESDGVFLLFLCFHFQLSSLFGRSPCTTCVQQVSYALMCFRCGPNDTLAAARSARGCR
jgi:hypothetical protein